ncbi:MAG: YchJ family metal-binding protein [Gallionella sp.]
MAEKLTPCPCGKGNYDSCCGPYHQGAIAADAESLMRSRYSAYVLKLSPYLLASWHASTRPAALDLATDTTKWLGLEIKNSHALSFDHATVKFVARYKISGRAHCRHEVSQFLRVAGQWRYVSSILNA